MVEPIAPSLRANSMACRLHEGPRLYKFSLVKTVDRLGECVVVRIADAANRGFDAGFSQALGIANGDKLDASIAVMNQAVLLGRLPFIRSCSNASSTKS